MTAGIVVAFLSITAVICLYFIRDDIRKQEVIRLHDLIENLAIAFFLGWLIDLSIIMDKIKKFNPTIIDNRKKRKK